MGLEVDTWWLVTLFGTFLGVVSVFGPTGTPLSGPRRPSGVAHDLPERGFCVFLGVLFSAPFFCDLGLRFVVQNNSRIHQNHSQNALWFPTWFRSRLLIDFCQFSVVSEPQKSCSRLHESRFFEKSPILFPDSFFA